MDECSLFLDKGRSFFNHDISEIALNSRSACSLGTEFTKIGGSSVSSESNIGSANSACGSRTAWNEGHLVKSVVTSTQGGFAKRRSLGTVGSRTTLDRAVSTTDPSEAKFA